MNNFNPRKATKLRPVRRLYQTLHQSLSEDNHYHLNLLWRHQILDPDSDIVAHWNYIFLVASLVALFIDPLYFFLPSMAGTACLQTDNRWGVLITFFRSVTDLFYWLHIAMKFRTAFVAPSSRVFGRGELVMDSREIAVRYLKSDFAIDLAAALPLPQIVNWLVIPATRDSRADHANNTLVLIVLIQYIPRLFSIYPLNQRIIKTNGVVAKTTWTGAAYNLLLYLLASHVLGASWYLMAIGRMHSCWRQECEKENLSKMPICMPSFLDCNSLDEPERQHWLKTTKVVSNCDVRKSDIGFKFGMFSDAFTNDISSSSFIEKYLYCLFWGLRNLSSYGQELETSTYIVETVFCTCLCIAGLILFALLIGNMQTYLQSMTVKLEEWRLKRRDTEEWMRHRQLPPNLQERVRRFVQYKWVATKGVNEDSIMRSLPVDFRREIQQHLCLSLIRRVPFFAQMDDQLLDAICERLVLSLSTEGTFIVQEGDPVSDMLFIIRGQLESSTTNGGRSGFFNSITLKPGDFCGEELLTWALMPNSSLNLPSSTWTVRALTEVEAFALQAEDLKFVAHQFKRLHNKKLQHAFRYYSHQWRTWSSCFIQAAWRRYKRRKMAKELAMQERFYFVPAREQGDGPNNSNQEGDFENTSGGTSSTRRGANQNVQVVEPSSNSLKMPKMFKPDEPDFSNENEDV